MIKHFCDSCGSELKKKYFSSNLDTAKVGDFQFNIRGAYKGTWNDIMLCIRCLREKVASCLIATDDQS